jgi:hypothetical protein
MKQENKKKLTVTGIMLIIAGIAGLALGNYILIGLPIMGALVAVAGFIMLVLGRKEDEFGPAKPVEAARKVEVTKKAEKPATLVGYRDHEGVFHGV